MPETIALGKRYPPLPWDHDAIPAMVITPDVNGNYRLAVDAQRAATVVEPADQVSTNAYALVAGSILDATNAEMVSYTLQNVGANTISYEVIAANQPGDLIIVQAATDVAAAAASSFSTVAAVWRYYFVFIIDKVGGDHGTARVRGVAKG